MHIDLENLKKLEKLSHLKIDDSKRDEMMKQLSDILAYVDNLNELDTEHLDVFFSTLKGGTPMREDIRQIDLTISNKILQNAPKQEDDFFVVPSII